MSDWLEAIEDEVEELFPPKPGGLVDQHRKAREAGEHAAEALESATSKAPQPAIYTVQVTEQMPEIVGAKTVNLGAGASALILPYDPMRRRAVVKVLTPGGSVGIAGSQPGADAAANGDMGTAFALYGPTVTPATPVSKSNYGTATAPAAGATITSITGLAAGAYNVEWTLELSGTPGANELDNFKLTVNGAFLARSVNAAATGIYVQDQAVVNVTTGTIAVLVNTNAGTAGAVYTARLIITPVNPATPDSALAPMELQSRGMVYAGNPGSSLVQVSVLTEVRSAS